MQTLSQKIFTTENNYSWTILRVMLGIVMLAHGVQKAFGWFDGYGWDGTMGYFTGVVGLPSILAAVILGAFFIDHLPNGFYMNWFGNQKGEGFEVDLLFLAISCFIAINGSGALSVDRWIASRKTSASYYNSVKRNIAA